MAFGNHQQRQFEVLPFGLLQNSHIACVREVKLKAQKIRRARLNVGVGVARMLQIARIVPRKQQMEKSRGGQVSSKIKPQKIRWAHGFLPSFFCSAQIQAGRLDIRECSLGST